MKMPLACPTCNGPLTSSFEPIWEIQHKICNKKIDHWIEFIATKGDNDAVDSIKIIFGPRYFAYWRLNHQSLEVKGVGIGAAEMKLPFFIPDLTNYRKLTAKLMTYLTFS